MNIAKQLLPEINALGEEFPSVFDYGINRDNLAETRAMLNDTMRLQAEAEREARIADMDERIIKFRGRNDDIRLLVLEPKRRIAGGPVMLWLHGGAYICGEPNCMFARQFAFESNCTFVCVDYRLAPEHPFPAGVEDAYDALLWLHDYADILDVDRTRIAVGGVGGGGGLAAGLCLMNRDLMGVDLIFQFLVYPMLDNLHDTPSGHAFGYPLWHRQTSLNAWEMYLNGTPGKKASPYASATRATDLSGLPATYIGVGQMDLFRDECVDYATRLMQAGVPTELGVFQDHVHGSEITFPDLPSSQRMIQSRLTALNDGLRISTARSRP